MYDPDGNLLTNGVFSYAWDAGNRMVAAYSSGVCVVSNVYDALSRRVQKMITPTSAHTFLYDGWNPVQETVSLASGTIATNRFFWGRDLSGTYQGAGGIGGLLAYAQNGALRIPLYDNLGNVVTVLDGGGSVVASFECDAFGNTIAATGPEVATIPLRFSTKYWEEETELYYFGYRFYSSGMGRWLNRDPIFDFANINFMCFCKNTPLVCFDNDGSSVSIDVSDPATIIPVIIDTNPHAALGRSGSGVKFENWVLLPECVCENDIWVRNYKISYSIVVTLCQEDVDTYKVSLEQIFGHEQKHVLSRKKVVETYVFDDYLGKNNDSFESKEQCEEDYRKYRLPAELRLKQALTQGDNHAGGSPDFSNDLSPVAGQGYDPLPQSIWVEQKR